MAPKVFRTKGNLAYDVPYYVFDFNENRYNITINLLSGCVRRKEILGTLNHESLTVLQTHLEVMEKAAKLYRY